MYEGLGYRTEQLRAGRPRKGCRVGFLAPQGQHKTLPLAVYRPTEYTFR